MSDHHKYGIFYAITRIVLAILTLLAMIGIIVGIVYWLNDKRGNSVEYLIWAAFCLLVAFCGFYGAYREHFMSTMIYGVAELILVLAGISFVEMQIYTRLTQIIAIVVAFIFAWMLYDGGHADMSMPCTV